METIGGRRAHGPTHDLVAVVPLIDGRAGERNDRIGEAGNVIPVDGPGQLQEVVRSQAGDWIPSRARTVAAQPVKRRDVVTVVAGGDVVEGIMRRAR